MNGENVAEILIKDETRLVIQVPSRSEPGKTHLVTATKAPDRLNCDCMAAQTLHPCHHMLDLKEIIDEWRKEQEKTESPVDVQYFSKILGECVQSQHHKARKFIEHECLQWDPDRKCFICLPIPGYNSTTYSLFHTKDSFQCDCQAFVKKYKESGHGFCSHVLALLIFLKRKENEQLCRDNCHAGR